MEPDLFNSVIYSKRRTLALQVMPDAQLIVRAPFGTSFKHIQKIISDKSSWIFNQQQIARQTFKPRIEKKYVNGEGFLYLGESYSLFISQNAKAPLVFDGCEFTLSQKHSENAEVHFIKWYKKQAKKIIHERAEIFAKVAGVTFKAVKINDAKKRWGSCSSTGNMNFPWRLIMAPIKIADYVVIHEISHITQRNHSRHFWARVKTLMPDYKEHRKWLRANGHSLGI